MQFPDRDAMTAAEAAANSAAQEQLVPGKYYRFEPPVAATAIPTGGLEVCALEVCAFERGWYLGFRNDAHVFQGKPVKDGRVIQLLPCCEGDPNPEEIREQLRESYFHVLFTGGSKAVVDPNQERGAS